MKVTGLSGKSGTGKSFIATDLSVSLGVDAIIDDGLLIAESRIIAGVSAKKEKTKIKAVKTAIFEDDQHAAELAEAIEKLSPKHVLILGTSDDMIKLIASRVGLPCPDEIIQIEDITSEKDRKIAREKRDDSGMHTIPVPTMQVKRQFSGFLIDPKRSFRTEENKTKTVIRPTYSYLGSFNISDRIIDRIVAHVAETTQGCAELLFSGSFTSNDGIYIRVIIMVEKGSKINEIAETLQRRIAVAVEHTTSFTVLGVEIEVRGYKTVQKDSI